MAKKKAAQSSFVMSAEMRKVVAENPKLKGKEAIDLLKKRFPEAVINENSANVAFSNARKSLGVGGGAPAAPTKRRPTATPAQGAPGDFKALEAARDFVETVGNPQAAIEAVKQLEKLQVGKG